MVGTPTPPIGLGAGDGAPALHGALPGSSEAANGNPPASDPTRPAGIIDDLNKQGISAGPRAKVNSLEPNTGGAIRAQDGDGTADLPNAPKIFTGDEQINIKKPRLEALVSVSSKLSPFALDSDRSEAVTLIDVLKATVARTLDITISDYDRRIGKSNFLGLNGQIFA